MGEVCQSAHFLLPTVYNIGIDSSLILDNLQYRSIQNNFQKAKIFVPIHTINAIIGYYCALSFDIENKTCSLGAWEQAHSLL